MPASAYAFRKASRKSPGLTCPPDRRITIKYTNAFTTYSLRRDLGVVYCMSDEYEARKYEGEPGVGIRLLFSKAPRRTPGLTSPSDGRIAINSRYAFTSYALKRNLEFNLGIF